MTPRQHAAAALIREGWPLVTRDPTDEGGVTKGGITLGALSDFLGHPATEAELLALDHETAIDVLLHLAPGYVWTVEDELLRDLLLDGATNYGATGVTRLLQRALGNVAIDGVFGPLTQAALAGVAADEVRVNLVRTMVDVDIHEARREVRGWCVAHGFDAMTIETETDMRFLRGWVRRRLGYIR